MPPGLQTDLAPLATLLEAAGGAGLAVFECEGRDRARTEPGIVRVGVDRQGVLPPGDLDDLDILLTSASAPPRPWIWAPDVDVAADKLAAEVERRPAAAAVAAHVMRMTLQVSFGEALTLESMAYSMLLASADFRAWRLANPPRDRGIDDAPRVVLFETDDGLEVRLSRPASRNAFDARMRDELHEALSFALGHPDQPNVILSGEGPSFSAGGDLDEFGRAPDPALAHLIRILRYAARPVFELGDRITARIHGACVGAGIEVPAAAARIVAKPDVALRLPEISMGLIPGAGGTATIPRRIGRRRATYMAISGETVDARTALHWGLVDEIAP